MTFKEGEKSSTLTVTFYYTLIILSHFIFVIFIFPIKTIKIEESVDGMLGIWTRNCKI